MSTRGAKKKEALAKVFRSQLAVLDVSAGKPKAAEQGAAAGGAAARVRLTEEQIAALLERVPPPRPSKAATLKEREEQDAKHTVFVYYEILGLLHELGYEETLEALAAPGGYLWNNRLFDPARQSEQEELALMSETPVGAKAEGRVCSICRSKDTVFFYTMQTRAGDEKITVFFHCTQCKGRWRE